MKQKNYKFVLLKILILVCVFVGLFMSCAAGIKETAAVKIAPVGKVPAVTAGSPEVAPPEPPDEDAAGIFKQPVRN